jgi:hypothetical protein
MTVRCRAAIVTAFLGASGAAGAQQANPLDVIPDKMPFNVPYGAPFRSLALRPRSQRSRGRRRSTTGR